MKGINIKNIGWISLIVTLVFSVRLSGQSDNMTKNEITFYAIPELNNINWDGPSSLFRSTFKGYVKSVFHPKSYVIGHAYVKIESPLLDSVLYIGMRSMSRSQNFKGIFKDGLGLGILGASLKGRLESTEEVRKSIQYYEKRGKISFIKVETNETAIKRVLDFIAQYQKENEFGLSPADFYNGALWPGYENEGAGCSAFALTILDLADAFPKHLYDDWAASIRIPMGLIGGQRYNRKKVNGAKLLMKNSWYKGSGVRDTDFVDFSIFVPDKIYRWILDEYFDEQSDYKTGLEGTIPGIIMDRKDSYFNPTAPIFNVRQDTTLFLRKYYEDFRGRNR